MTSIYSTPFFFYGRRGYCDNKWCLAQSLAGVGIVVLIFVVVLILIATGVISTDQRAIVSKELTRQGWVFYGSDSCGHCVNQKLELDLAHATYVNCDTAPNSACSKVTAYPTWMNSYSGKSELGFKTLAELRILAGLPDPDVRRSRSRYY